MLRNVSFKNNVCTVAICYWFPTGFSSLSPAPISFNKLGSETVAEEPVLIIISVGADPSQELQEIAYKVVGEEHYHQVYF